MAKNDEQKNNLAFVDGQNMYMSTTSADKPWRIDLARFRVYLRRKYGVEKAYYFLGFVQEKYQDLYDEIQSSGFILKFKEHNPAMLGVKKGNVDTDIVFYIMKMLYRKESFDNVVLVSGDGDYKEERRFEKILFPNQMKASSLYKSIELKYRADLGAEQVRRKIKKEKGSLGS